LAAASFQPSKNRTGSKNIADQIQPIGNSPHVAQAHHTNSSIAAKPKNPVALIPALNNRAIRNRQIPSPTIPQIPPHCKQICRVRPAFSMA
jgi:hypothetical protein